MNDIVKEARFYANDVQHIVRGHLERIQALESQLNLSELARLGLLESLEQFRQALDWGEENRVLGFERIQELEQERDAALETLRLERLSQFVNKADVIRAETLRDYSDARVVRMAGKMEEARQERDAALEQVRVLEEAKNA